MAKNNELIEVDILGSEDTDFEGDEDNHSDEEILAELEAGDEQPECGLTEEEKFWWNSPNNVDKGDE